MSVQIKEVKTKRDLRKFISFPYKLHKDHKTWVPPLYSDERKFFETAIENGIKQIESHLILETNIKMLGEVEKVGGKLHKRFRIFKKDLLL